MPGNGHLPLKRANIRHILRLKSIRIFHRAAKNRIMQA
jgi:hypothetical protein